ncbi:DUF2975 domain-containing protein [uncultured Brevundimonas sp.]|uniref:DUF2975 domain-containing protein n=1 Tax=uncultured Brevundimonas sp. TaxID=213418 RepID=UPI0025E5202A|nr:DUF2975 domain-containing protein [uncultured Brevundimonas sp.]
MVALVGRRSVASVVRWGLGLANVFVAIGAVACLLALVATLLVPDFLAGALEATRDADPALGEAKASTLWAVMSGGFFACAFTWLVVDRLRRIFLAVNQGRAFELANVNRLRTIGASLAGLEISGLVIRALAPLNGSPRFELDIGAWLGVLIVFMLAEVFRQGAGMRDDVEATV